MPLLDKETIRGIAGDFADNSPANRVSAEIAIRPDLAGMRIYQRPLVGFASATDPLFEEMLRPEIIGDHFVTPVGWLPGALSVISFFMPFTDAVVDSNRIDPILPSDEWLHGRIEGQGAVNALGAVLVREMESAGYQAIYPSSSERFWSWAKPAGINTRGMRVPGHTSNWSERHIAYACGLGTFSLSMGLITEKGTAGRFGSVVTTMPIPADVRPYAKHDEYCTRCGVCAKHCFVDAITLENGKNKNICELLLDERKIQYKPRYGCGKCNVNVPCERKNPTRRAAVTVAE